MCRLQAAALAVLVLLLCSALRITAASASERPLSAHASTRDRQLHLRLTHGRHEYVVSLAGLSPHTLLSTELIFTVSELDEPTHVLTIPVNPGPAHDHDEDEHGDTDGSSGSGSGELQSLQYLPLRDEWTELDDPIWTPPPRDRTHRSPPAAAHSSTSTSSSSSRSGEDEDEDEEEDQDGDDDEEMAEGEEADGAVSEDDGDPEAASFAGSLQWGGRAGVTWPTYAEGEQPLLALVMIVKNEAAGIAATLDSTFGYVDHYCILDTGSTDGTLDIVRSFFSALPPQVTHDLFEEPFVDFSTTRNRALQLTGQRAEFVLMMNGDDRLVGGEEMRRFLETRRGMTAMDEAIYIIPIDYGGLAVGRSERLARTRNHAVPGWPNDSFRHWRFEGVTHEAYVCNAALQSGAQIIYTQGDFRVYHDVSQDTPDKKQARFELDIALLQQELKDHPDAFNTPRNMYYLAQSYYNLERWDEAADWYERRVGVNYVRPTPWGEDNEKHRAYTLLAHIAEKQARPHKQIEAYWKKSWEACPAAFSLFSLAKSLRDRGELDKALTMAEKAKKVLVKGSPVVCNGDDVLVQKQLPTFISGLQQSSRAKQRQAADD